MGDNRAFEEYQRWQRLSKDEQEQESKRLKSLNSIVHLGCGDIDEMIGFNKGYSKGYDDACVIKDREIQELKELLKKIIIAERGCNYDIGDRASFNANAALVSAVNEAKKLIDK